MKVLFIGGTGTISTACTQLATARGIELYLLNRGQRQVRVPEGVLVLTDDINDTVAVQALLGDHVFDAVVNWIVFRQYRLREYRSARSAPWAEPPHRDNPGPGPSRRYPPLLPMPVAVVRRLDWPIAERRSD